MIFTKVCWTRKGFKAFDDLVNLHIQQGMFVKDIVVHSGIFGLRTVMVAILTDGKKPAFTVHGDIPQFN